MGAAFSYGGSRLTSTSFPGGSSRYAYDVWGAVIKESLSIGTLGLAVGYRYLMGDLTGITYPSGRQLELTVTQGRTKALSLDGASLLSQIEWTLSAAIQ